MSTYIEKQEERIGELLKESYHIFTQGIKDIDLSRLELSELERLEEILKTLLNSKDELDAFESDHLADIK
jgi:hypothetical protein